MTTTRILAALALLGAGAAHAGATITIVNNNAAGVGFNDPTPAAPVGGNPGTTLGAQRLNAFKEAARIWGAALDSSVEIKIDATFTALACTATSATLGSAGARSVFANFPNAALSNVWHHGALANKQAGQDLAPTASDIAANFNVNLGNPGCLTGTGWYLGFDAAHGNNIDLVTVLLHEFAHGLGFSSQVSRTTGQFLGFPSTPLTDVYTHQLADFTTARTWDSMTAAERLTSMVNTRRVGWIGPRVTAAVPATLAEGTPVLRISTPASAAGDYVVGAAAFGAPVSAAGVGGTVVLVNDGVAPVTDACSALPAGSLAGKVALIDRGTCSFESKALVAQNAGAAAVIIANNAAGSPPPGLGGSNLGATITTVSVTLADGNKLKAALADGPMTASLLLDLAIRAGASADGHALTYNPNPVVAGSSVSHWDTSASPNLLMEPAINGDLTHGLDLTLPLLRDVGWFVDHDLDLLDDDADQCTDAFDNRATVVVGSCDSGVANVYSRGTGCSYGDRVRDCGTAAANHGEFVSCVAAFTNGLKATGLISGRDHGAIQRCAAGAAIP